MEGLVSVGAVTTVVAAFNGMLGNLKSADSEFYDELKSSIIKIRDCIDGLDAAWTTEGANRQRIINALKTHVAELETALSNVNELDDFIQNGEELNVSVN